MVSDNWLTLAVTGVSAGDVDALLTLVAGLMADRSGVAHGRIERGFRESLAGEGWSLGQGVAVPHIELPDLDSTVVCLVTLSSPLALDSIDGRKPDVFVFILSMPDPKRHLLLLAHIARLMRSRTLVEGLRRAESPAAVSALLHAAELRHDVGPRQPVAARAALVVITVSGERAVDALLVDLVDQGFDEACIVEAQSARQAAAREVPLFAGFRDIFGDPGGRRVIMVDTSMERAEQLMAASRRVSEEHPGSDIRVAVMPLASHWQAAAPAAAEEPAAH